MRSVADTALDEDTASVDEEPNQLDLRRKRKRLYALLLDVYQSAFTHGVYSLPEKGKLDTTTCQ